MPISNSEIAEYFYRYALLLEIKGDNPFRIRAYNNAARVVEDSSQNISSLVSNKEDLTKLPGIGNDLANKIQKIVKTGKFHALDQLEKKFPAHLVDLAKIPGLGPKKIKKIYDNLKISSLEELKKACRDGRLNSIEGFGDKTQQNIIKAIGRLKKTSIRQRLYSVEQIVESLLKYLKRLTGIKDVTVAGSYRRRKSTVGDIDILITAKSDADIIKNFKNYKDIKDIIAEGKTKSTVILKSGLQLDLRVVPKVSYPTALLYFTGSKSHNVELRKLAIKKGLKINEYGIYKKDKRITIKSEQDIYKLFNMAYIEPELRENRGELEAARKSKLPKLITIDDIKGDLHVHTKATDGRNTLEELIKAAKERNYKYLAITDHTKHLTVAHGQTAKEIEKQLEQIDKINEKYKGIKLLKSAEVDILEDGTLDLPDYILKKLDFTVCSVHYKFNLSEKKQTERIIRAMDNQYFNILGHATGRLIGEREPYSIDLEKIIKAAAERGVFLEINSQPKRMDIDDIHCKLAKEYGAKLAISTDSHNIDSLDYIRLGIDQARRGWLEKSDVINTYSLNKLKKMLKR